MTATAWYLQWKVKEGQIKSIVSNYLDFCFVMEMLTGKETYFLLIYHKEKLKVVIYNLSTYN